MEANELRIGNLVNTISRFGKVHLPVKIPFYVAEIEQGKIRGFVNGTPIHQVIKYHDVPIRDLVPIPITEEWLYRFGFEVYDRMGMGDSIFLSLDDGKNHGWNVHLYDMDCLIGFNGMDWEESFEIKHVHQLQNLYFALIGEELKLNEK